MDKHTPGPWINDGDTISARPDPQNSDTYIAPVCTMDPDWDPSIAAAKAAHGRMVRLGTYGDPAAAPVAIWQALTANAAGHTGYTHQWRNLSIARELLASCMASADTPADRLDAKAMGYRTFRIRTEKQTTMPGEFACPASEEQGKRKTCAECGACNGGLDTAKADPVIIVHGSLKTRMQAAYH